MSPSQTRCCISDSTSSLGLGDAPGSTHRLRGSFGSPPKASGIRWTYSRSASDPAYPYAAALARFSALVIALGGRIDVVYPFRQIVLPKVSGVTLGLIAPGVQAGSGRVSPLAACREVHVSVAGCACTASCVGPGPTGTSAPAVAPAANSNPPAASAPSKPLTMPPSIAEGADKYPQTSAQLLPCGVDFGLAGAVDDQLPQCMPALQRASECTSSTTRVRMPAVRHGSSP